MIYSDIETLDDSPLHLRFAEKKSRMSPTRLAVISKLLTIMPEEEKQATTDLLDGVRFVTYSDKAVAVIGNTFPIKEQIKEAGGNWNKFLTIDGKKQGGWILPTKKANELQEKLSGGKSGSATQQQPKKTKAKTSTPTTSTPPKREKASDSEYMRWKPEPLFDKNKKEVQSLVLMPRAIEELIAEMTADVEKYKKAIADLDIVPKDWQGTKKEYVQSMKETRDNLAYFRDERSQNITALKNRKLDDVYLKRELEDKVSEILDNESDGKLTDKQIEQFIKENEATSFSKVDKSLDYYPTPVDVVKKMIDKADLRCGQKILEPSAGKGNIADAIVQKIGNCADLHVIEYSDHNRMLLEAKNYNVVGTNFLEFGTVSRNERGIPKFADGVLYDRIVMNPPYNNGADFVHISHAYKLLADDGILVALVPAESYLGLGREATQKRAFIEANEGTITVIKASDYNKNLEFTQLTIDVAIITMRRRNVEVYTSNMQTTNNEEFGQYMDLPKEGDTPLPKLDPSKKDTSFVKPKTVMAREEFVNKNIPDYVAKIKTEKPLGLFDYQRFGVNKAIHGLLNHSGFLLADGTGTGKTIQMLMTALYFYQTTKKPVAIFTIDKRVLTTSFMKDGKKMRFPVPEYVEQSEKVEVERPQNYRGLYDRIEDKFDKNTIIPDKNFPPIYEGNEKTLELRDGINIFTYNALSYLEIRDKSIEQKVKMLQEQVKINRSFWKDISNAGATNIYKNKDQNVMTEIFTKWGHVYQSLDEGEKKEIEEKRQYNLNVWYDKIIERCKTNDYQKDYNYFKSRLKIDAPIPKIAEAEATLIEAQDAYKGSIREALSPILHNTSLVIFDEAHSIKNLLLNLEKQAGRAFYANMITEETNKVMFATATPTDRPYDILYLKRAGLFDGDESDFRRIMAHVGVFYNDPKYNEDGKLIRRGRWVLPKDSKSLATANYYLGNVFDYITRKGTMLRREIQYTNVDVDLIDVVVPHSIRAELDAITEDCTKIDNDGKARVQRLAELQRHQQAVEEYKLDEVIALTDKELAEGRSVVIFTSMVDTGEEERTDGTLKLGSIRILKNRLSLRYGEDTVGVLATTTSEYDKYKRLKNIDEFLSNDKRILIATIKSGGTGVSLDDQLGYAPRTIIVVTPPLSFIDVIQGIGRVVRANTLSRSRVYFLYAKTDHPDKRESYIPVEVWLKRLIGSKFKTLQAAVKGEVKVLDPAKVTQVEAAGEDAFVDAFESDLMTSPNKHSLYSKTNAAFNGWDMPTPSSISIQRIGNIHSHTVYVKARTKEELYTWAKENEEFINKYGLELNLDNNYRRYNGSHYGKSFHHRDKNDWKESYELWNALLNMIKPEETKYLVSKGKAFAVNEKVMATTDIVVSNVKKGMTGKIENIIPVTMGANADGDITQYLYDVVWENKKTSISLESWQLSKINVTGMGKDDEQSLNDGMLLSDKYYEHVSYIKHRVLKNKLFENDRFQLTDVRFKVLSDLVKKMGISMVLREGFARRGYDKKYNIAFVAFTSYPNDKIQKNYIKYSYQYKNLTGFFYVNITEQKSCSMAITDSNNNELSGRTYNKYPVDKEHIYDLIGSSLDSFFKKKNTTTAKPETLHVKAKVRRYEGGWELGIIDGEEDTPDGKNAVCKDGDYFVPIINIKTGQILNWEQGKTAHISYKITDECYWELRDSNNVVISSNEDYVPNTLSPAEEGWGDYMIMNIDKNGFIDKWKFNRKDFKPRK